MTHSRNQKRLSNTIIGLFACAALVWWLCGCETNTSQPVEQPKIVAPEEWKAISHDSTHPTPLNAWIDKDGVLQTEFK
jgi:hypothetical protein